MSTETASGRLAYIGFLAHKTRVVDWVLHHQGKSYRDSGSIAAVLDVLAEAQKPTLEDSAEVADLKKALADERHKSAQVRARMHLANRLLHTAAASTPSGTWVADYKVLQQVAADHHFQPLGQQCPFTGDSFGRLPRPCHYEGPEQVCEFCLGRRVL